MWDWATKLNKCRCKSQVIFTAAAGILIFTAEVGLIVPADPIEKDLSIQICHTLFVFVFVHTHFSPAVTHLLRRTSLHTNLSLPTAIGQHPHTYSLWRNIWYWDCLGFCLLIFANINTCKRQLGQPPCEHPYEAKCKLWSLHQSETNWDSLGKLTLWMW